MKEVWSGSFNTNGGWVHARILQNETTTRIEADGEDLLIKLGCKEMRIMDGSAIELHDSDLAILP